MASRIMCGVAILLRYILKIKISTLTTLNVYTGPEDRSSQQNDQDDTYHLDQSGRRQHANMHSKFVVTYVGTYPHLLNCILFLFRYNFPNASHI